MLRVVSGAVYGFLGHAVSQERCHLVDARPITEDNVTLLEAHHSATARGVHLRVRQHVFLPGVSDAREPLAALRGP